MYYEGDGANRITIGRDMGWGRISQVVFAGAITPAMGNSSTAGIQFPADPGGGAGDTAWIRYYPRQGESCTLELGVSNDADDHIALMSSGNVGIGTSDPKAKLDVMGDIAIQSQHAFRGNDAWLRLNQDGAFSAGVHTPGLFAPSSLNVGGLSSWGNPGGGNVWIAGNVGIGTSDPKANLDVNGTLRARAMRVDIHNVSAEGFTLSSSNQWGDFNNLGLSLVLTQDTDVTVSYGISMTCRIGDNFGRAPCQASTPTALQSPMSTSVRRRRHRAAACMAWRAIMPRVPSWPTKLTARPSLVAISPRFATSVDKGQIVLIA